ncbi:hypothetical protein TNCT_607331 [Trichonephila clavata]|uniref:RRM domain-containing protein n=1 Tax=Trichonephila clavata TaxID=2740835 RepID=A0A8X6KAL9_TRICU|nr:hypothetical protein TNCT_607331 [Trichonephila clavata]
MASGSNRNRFIGKGFPETVYMRHRIFVGQLPIEIQNEDLVNIFSKFGAIKYARIAQGKWRQDPGYGFITFETEDGAEKAFKASIFEGIYYKQRKLFINIALKGQPSKTQEDIQNVNKFSKYALRPKTIYIAPIPMGVGDDELKFKFAKFGFIEHVKIQQGERLSGSQFFRYGFVTFRTEDDAQKAVEMNKIEPITLKGRNIDVTPAFSKKAEVKRSPVSEPCFIANKIFVGCLPLRTECTDLQKLFQKYGVVRYATVLKGNEVNRSPYGFVAFQVKEVAQKVIEVSNTYGIFMKGKRLRVAPAINKSSHPGAGMSSFD